MAVSSFGFQYVVYFYALMLAIMVIWGILTIKDTDQLSLVEIQDMDRDAKQKKEEKEETREVDAGNVGKALEVVFKSAMEQRARRRKISVLNEQNLLEVINEESARRHKIHGAIEQNGIKNPSEVQELCNKTIKRDERRKWRKISCKF